MPQRITRSYATTRRGESRRISPSCRSYCRSPDCRTGHLGTSPRSPLCQMADRQSYHWPLSAAGPGPSFPCPPSPEDGRGHTAYVRFSGDNCKAAGAIAEGVNQSCPSQATSSDGNSEGSCVKMSFSSVLASAGKETTDEKPAEHFGQCPM